VSGWDIARLVAWLLVAASLAQIAMSMTSGEPPNENGWVPGVGRAYMLATIAYLLLVGAGLIRSGSSKWRLSLLAVAAVSLLGGTYLVVWVAQDSLRETLHGSAIALLALFGFIGTLWATVWLLVLLPMMSALAWLVDQVPALRRRGAGTEMRRQIDPKGWLARVDDRPSR
jgi:hypothetical protein